MKPKSDAWVRNYRKNKLNWWTDLTSLPHPVVHRYSRILVEDADERLEEMGRVADASKTIKITKIHEIRISNWLAHLRQKRKETRAANIKWIESAKRESAKLDRIDAEKAYRAYAKGRNFTKAHIDTVISQMFED